MIKRPDEYGHNNPDYAIADSDSVRGGGRVVTDLTALYALSTKADQLKVRVTRVWVTAEAKYYVLKDMTNVGNSGGWEIEVTGGGAEVSTESVNTALQGFNESTPTGDSYIPFVGKVKAKLSAVTTVIATLLGNTFAAKTHGHSQSDITNLSTDLAGKASTSHNHSGTYEPVINKSIGLLSWTGTALAWVTNNFLTSSSLKTVNGNSLVGAGDISIEGGDPYTHPSTHPTTILEGVDASNGAEDYFLNKKGEFKRVEAGSSETGLTIRAKLEALAGEDKLNYTALKGVVSSYTLDFRDDVTQVQDINIEGDIRIDAIQTVNVATLQLGAVTLTLPLSAPINIAQGSYNVWTITRNNASAASVGIKYTKL